eukprot:gene1535-39573_t
MSTPQCAKVYDYTKEQTGNTSMSVSQPAFVNVHCSAGTTRDLSFTGADYEVCLSTATATCAGAAVMIANSTMPRSTVYTQQASLTAPT